MRPEKYQAVAQIVSAMISKDGNIPPTARPGTMKPDGLSVRFEEGRVALIDGEENKMMLEELIQYVDRYLA